MEASLKIKYEENENRSLHDIEIDREIASKQFAYEIEGIEVYFPYKPYDCQMEYMKSGKIN